MSAVYQGKILIKDKRSRDRKSTVSEASSEGHPRKKLRTDEEYHSFLTYEPPQEGDNYYEQAHAKMQDATYDKIMSKKKDPGPRVNDYAAKPLLYYFRDHPEKAYLSWTGDHIVVSGEDCQ